MSTLIALVRADAVLDAPIVPAQWEAQVESNGWTTCYPLGKGRADVFFHARLILRQAGNPQRALFVCTGPAAVLQRLADAIASDALPWTRTWASAAALRADGGAIAQAAKAAWPDDRQRPNTGTLEAPVLGAPIGPIVALRARMAGYDAEDAES